MLFFKFQLKIGFLKPNSIAKVVVGYVTEVNNDPDTNSIRFFMPTTVAPRYVPGSETDQRSTDLAGMSHSADPPAPLSIKVVAAIQGGIKAVRSLSHHKIRVESRGPIPERIGWTKAVVTLVDHVTEMDRDFVLLVHRRKPWCNPGFTQRLFVKIKYLRRYLAGLGCIPKKNNNFV